MGDIIPLWRHYPNVPEQCWAAADEYIELENRYRAAEEKTEAKRLLEFAMAEKYPRMRALFWMLEGQLADERARIAEELELQEAEKD